VPLAESPKGHDASRRPYRPAATFRSSRAGGASRRDDIDRERAVQPAVDDNGLVAYDEDLANRVRELIAGDPDVTEKKMFGGLAFLVGGNMSVGASGQGGLMVRVEPKDTDALVTKPHARPFEMRGRAIQGWLRVEAEGLRTKRQLEPWVMRGVAYARSLPPKH